MFWIGTAIVVIAAIIALASVKLAHPVDASDLDPVSTHWLAEHRAK